MRTVWLSGNSGAGKTFTGDYLARVCGFFHVEGDAAAFSTDPADRALFGEFVKAFEFWFKSAPAPPALWQPYFDRQIAAVRAAHAAGHADVVVSLTVYHREVRDYVRAALPTHDFILLRCDADELVRRARVRFQKYAEVCGQTFEACFETQNKEPYTDAAFDAATRRIMHGLQPLEPDEVRTHELDVTSGAPWGALHALLGLPPPPEVIPLDEIAETNYARFRAPPPQEPAVSQ